MTLVNTTARRLRALGAPYRMSATGKMEEERGWTAANVVTVKMPTPLPIAGMPAKTRASVKIHRRAAAQLRAVFAELQARGLWRHFLTFSGDHVVRRTQLSGSRAVSSHAFALALDFNSEQLPQKSTRCWPAAVVAVWNRHGFINGAGFATKDPMHFQCVKLYP